MKSYTVGLIFNSTLDKVALMEKNRPAWQVGKLNGIGGRIEESESAIACMVREAEEEGDISTEETDWKQFAVLKGPSWQVDFFALRYAGKESDLKTSTDEKVDWYNALTLPENCVMNISWLVPLALEKLKTDEFDTVVVTYNRDY